MSTKAPLGSITVDLDELFARAFEHMSAFNDLSFPIRMALGEMHEDLITKLEERLMQEYERIANLDK
jgi:S-adenosylmethionine synthetase